MDKKQDQVFPAYRLVAEFADGSRLLFDGFTYEQARDAMEQAQYEHGDITWYDGVTDDHYENGKYYAAFPPPHSPPIIELHDGEDFEQQTLPV